MSPKNGKKSVCENCGSSNLKSKITTYPVQMGERQMNIGRVSVKECQDCLSLYPTQKGKEKIGRLMVGFSKLFG